MELDMYALTLDAPPASQVDFTPDEVPEQLHYWRKDSNLHGWMEQRAGYETAAMAIGITTPRLVAPT
jgi:hypothetical protein